MTDLFLMIFVQGENARGFKTEKIANVPKVVVFLRFFRLDGDQGYSTHLSGVLEQTGAHKFEANN